MRLISKVYDSYYGGQAATSAWTLDGTGVTFAAPHMVSSPLLVRLTRSNLVGHNPNLALPE